MATADLAILLRLQDEASRALRAATNELHNMDRGTQTANVSWLKLATAIGGAEIAVHAIEGAFHKLSGAVETVTKGSVEAFMKMGDATHKLQLETGLTAEQASGLIGVFRREGQTADEISRSLGILSKNLESFYLKTSS